MVFLTRLRESTVYRVNWLRAKCRSDRWSEEVILAKSELEWTRLFFKRRAEVWDDRSKSVALLDPELQYYGRRQATTWRLLQSKVENAIKETSAKPQLEGPGRIGDCRDVGENEDEEHSRL